MTDAKGAPVPSYPVSFVVTGGGGSVAAASVLTDASGVASTTWILGTSTATPQTAEARVMSRDGAATVGTVAFTATAAPAAPAALTRIGPDSLTGPAGAALADSVRVRLADQYGNPVRGVSVAFAVASGGGAVAPATATTDSLGRAAAAWTLGPATGANTLTTSVPSASAVSALTLSAIATATGTPGAATTILKVSGDSQSAVAGTALADSLVVKVTDAAGRNVAGAVVNFSSFDGTLAPTTATTRGDGTARARWTLPAGAGTRTAIAAVGGVGSVSFTATATPPAATTIEVVSPLDALGTPGSAVTHGIVARVLDGAGAPVANVTVTATVTAGGGKIAQYGLATISFGNVPIVTTLTLTTDAAGKFVIGTWYLGPDEGTNSLTLTAGGSTRVISTLASHTPFRAVDLGGRVGCGIGIDGDVYCWGDNTGGQLGAPSLENSPYWNSRSSGSRLHIPIPARLVAISVHGQQCGVDGAGVGYCWGANYYGETGQGYYSNSLEPSFGPIRGGLTWSRIETGALTTCGLTTARAAFCWGAVTAGMDTVGVRGYYRCGSAFAYPCVTIPRPVVTSATFIDIAVGTAFACGVATDGTAYCWGRNDYGQLGRGVVSPTGVQLPVDTVLGGHRYSTISGSNRHVCGVAADNGLTYCWGSDSTGQLGDGGRTTQATPAAVATGQRFVRLATGGNFSCGLTTAGNAYCWGGNNAGQLGDGTTTASLVPVAVAGGLRFQSITASDAGVCGALANGVIFCWGETLGVSSSTTTPITTPVRLEFQL